MTTMSTMSTGGVTPVETVRRALRVLSCFSKDAPVLGVSDISRSLSIHKSTVHRLLISLESEGFVRKLDDSRYTLGWKVIELGADWPILKDGRAVILEHLERLTKQTGETSHLATLQNGKVLYIEKMESRHQLRMPSAVGRRVPIHSTGLGKVMVASLSEEMRRPLIFERVHERFTDSTITEPELIDREIRKAAEQGYAIDHEEIEPGLMCIAAPVRCQGQRGVAALSIAGPVSRIAPQLDAHIASVKHIADELSHRLDPDAFSKYLGDQSVAEGV